MSDFDELDALLAGETTPPVQKATAKKTAAKVPAPKPEPAVAVPPVIVDETSETFETSGLGDVTADADVTAALIAQMQATLAEQAETIRRLQETPATVVNQTFVPGELPDAVLARRNPNQVDAHAILSAQVGESVPSLGRVLVHFVDDGFTIGSKVFYRGEEAHLDEATANLSTNQQRLRYGRVMFGKGPWQGEGFDLNDPALNESDRARLVAIMEKQAKLSHVV